MASYGIDIGTSSCKACKFDGETCQPIRLTDSFTSFWGNDLLLVSAAYLDGDHGNELLVGQSAYNLHLQAPQWYLQEFKRQFAHKGPILFTEEAQATVDDIYVQLLSKLNEDFAQQNEPVDTLVLTHPSAYPKELVECLVDDAHRAGFFNVETIDEPSAAAQYYAFSHHGVAQGENILVYDFGGGTFDTALIRLGEKGFSHLTRSLGLKDCGGADIDELIFSDIQQQLMDHPELDSAKMLEIPNFVSNLHEIAVRIKHKLTTQKSAPESIMVGYKIFSYQMDHTKLEEMIRPLIQRTLDLCRKIVDNANLQPKDINRVLLVGGTSRIPLIAELLKTCFPAAVIAAEGHLEHMVCYGAAISGYGSEADRLKKAAERGDLDAITRLALYYLEGDHPEIQQDIKNGLSLLKTATAKQHPYASSILGTIYWNGFFGESKDHEAAYPLLEYAAMQGLASAQDLLGDYYNEKDNQEKAVFWYRKAAEQGDPDSQLSLGLKCFEQNEYSEAMKWISLSAKQNNRTALYYLGVIYEQGWGTVSANPQKSFENYYASAELGDPDSQFEVGFRYYSGGEPVQEDNDQAFYWLSKASENGHMMAKALLAECYEKGFGTTVNLNLALENYLAAAEAGIKTARDQLAMWFYVGKEPILQQNYEEAFRWASKAAEQDAERSLYILALCYDNGHGTTKSRSKAFEFYRRASEQGHFGAMDDLAWIYFKGTHGVKKNPHLAFEWGMKAAENGYANSQFLIGYCYDEGLGVRADQRRAIQWYKKAAEQGNTAAMRNIGILYYNGEGNVTKDNAVAEHWFKEAAKNGDDEAIDILKNHFAPKPQLADPVIIFRRNSKFLGGARNYEVRLDLSTRLQTLKNGTSFTVAVQPGEHRIEVTNGPVLGGSIDWSTDNCVLDQTFQFDPGDILVVDCTVGSSRVYWQQIAGVQQ